MVATLVLEASVERRASSSLAPGTIVKHIRLPIPLGQPDRLQHCRVLVAIRVMKQGVTPGVAADL